jgi:hypothetical protein
MPAPVDQSAPSVAPAAADARRTGAGRQPSGWRERLLLALFGLALFGLALAPRWVGRDVFVTSDEDSWMRRAGGFAWGVANGRLGRTYQNGHPGVLTMELAILGQGPGGAERFADPVTNARLVTAVPGFFDGLVSARRAFALASAALVVLIGLLAWRLFGPGPALAGGVLLALDPFFLAHSQLVHTDALLAGLSVSAALCGLVRYTSAGGRRWVLAAGVLTGLALLAKVPAVVLGLYAPLLAFTAGRRRGPRALAADLAVWAGAALATCYLLWPSLWVNPTSTIARMLEFARETGGQPDEVGSFFLGQVWGDPGPLFYPVALAFRLTPLACLGLLALLLGRPMRRLLRGRWPAVFGLAGFGLAFLLFVTAAEKKFDRYVLPVAPVLQLLAGLGLWLLYRRLRPFLAFAPRRQVAAGLLAGLVAIQAAALASVFPYSMTYFNPLLGGGPGAAAAVMVGNGEGMDQVADYFNRLPEVDQIWVAAHSFDLLAAQCRCNGEPLRERPPSDAHYLVLYGRRIQLRRWGPALETYLAQHQPLHTVRINGIQIAQIYPGPKLRPGGA